MYTCLKGAVSTPLDFLKIGEKISIAHTTFSYIFLGLRMVVTRYHNSWLRNTCNMTIENNVNINKEQSKSICTFYVSRNTNRMFFVQNSLPYKVCIKGWQQKLLKPHFIQIVIDYKTLQSVYLYLTCSVTKIHITTLYHATLGKKQYIIKTGLANANKMIA